MSGLRPDWFPHELFPFESHFVRVGDSQIHYVEEGRGPTLLLVHANPTWSFLYRHIIRELAPSFRCIAPDLPGFGLSTAPHFLEALERRLQSISGLPALIVWGNRDFAFRETERLRFESIFTNHSTVILEGASHFIQEDAPEEIARAIKTWWTRSKGREVDSKGQEE
jgi:pimeloyl-ACP methyl ester carboxylesterase